MLRLSSFDPVALVRRIDVVPVPWTVAILVPEVVVPLCTVMVECNMKFM